MRVLPGWATYRLSASRQTGYSQHTSLIQALREYVSSTKKRIGGCIPARRLKPLPGVLSLYTLTGICAVEYIRRMESAFEIIAEPNRRAILSLLVSSQQSVGEIERQLRMSQPTVSKHLRVLRESGFVESRVDAQRRLYRLKPEPFQEVDAWLAPFRRFWEAHVDALERYLDRMDQPTPTKRKPRKKPRGPNRQRDKGEKK
jgi:DNA-binding transcriptional ArsR family regulator